MPEFHLLELIFFTFLGIQLLFYFFQYLRLAFHKSDFKTEQIKPVSIVVAARDEYANLQKLIPALLAQQHPDFEVIIVDDRSSDESYDFLMEQAARFPQLKFVRIDETPEHVSTKKYALTLGIKKAVNDIILLTDADCIPGDPQWAAKMSARHTDQKLFVLGFSPYEKTSGLLNAFIRFETLQTGIQYLSAALSGFPYMGVGRNLSYRRSFFLENKGFQKHLRVISGDDDLFVNEHATSKNTTVCVQSGAYTLSAPKKTWSEYFSQKKRHLSVGKKYRFTDKIRLAIEHISHIFCYIFFALALIWGFEQYIVLGGFLFRVILQYVIAASFLAKMRIKFDLWLLPILDLMYVCYYMIMGPVAALNKKIEWK